MLTHSYEVSYGWDAMIMLFVAMIMPIAVMFMRSNKAWGQVMGFGLLAMSFGWLCGFEWYRALNYHAVTVRGVNRTIWQPLMDYYDGSYKLNYLPMNIDGAELKMLRVQAQQTTVVTAEAIYHANGGPNGTTTVTTRCNPMKTKNGSPRRIGKEISAEFAGVPASELESLPPCDDSVFRALGVHLAYPFTGMGMFKDAFDRFSSQTCNSPEFSECMNWSQGYDVSPIQDTTAFFQLEEPKNPAQLQPITRPYSAIFTVRDPRDMVVELYFKHYNPAGAFTHKTHEGAEVTSLFKDYEEEDERVGATGMASRHLLSDMNQEDAINTIIEEMLDDTTVDSYLKALKEFARAKDPKVAFVRYEELLSGDKAFNAIGQWYQLEGENLDAFTQALSQARSDETENLWERHFTPENKKRFLKRHGRLLNRMGYS